MNPVRVYGDPIPQGSMKWLPNHRVTSANPRLHEWRARLSDGLAEHPRVEGPVVAWLDFFVRRPPKHRGAHGLKAWAVNLQPTSRPDLDKLVRAVLDAATDAGTLADDSHVVQIHATKRYADDLPHVAILFTETADDR